MCLEVFLATIVDIFAAMATATMHQPQPPPPSLSPTCTSTSTTAAVPPWLQAQLHYLRTHSPIPLKVVNLRSGTRDGRVLDRFSLFIPCCLSYVKWEVVYNGNDTQVAPDIIFGAGDETFQPLMDKSDLSPCYYLRGWTVADHTRLLKLVLVIRGLYLQYQRKKVEEVSDERVRFKMNTMDAIQVRFIIGGREGRFKYSTDYYTKMGLLHIYAETDNPRCGMTRKSSKYNWNLVKAELGHGRRITQKIRDPKFIYGKPGELGALGVKEVIVHLENIPPSEAERYGPDFKKMNKIAAINHYTKANEQRAARERFYHHIKPKNALNTKWRLPSDKNPNHRYGFSVPIEGGFEQIIGGGYQNEWIEMNEYFKAKYPDRYREPPARLEIISNRATDLQQQVVRNRLHPLPPKPRFILSRFKNVSKKVDMVNNTPLKRTGPYHKFYGIKGANNQPACDKGIHR